MTAESWTPAEERAARAYAENYDIPWDKALDVQREFYRELARILLSAAAEGPEPIIRLTREQRAAIAEMLRQLEHYLAGDDFIEQAAMVHDARKVFTDGE
jgi:hypothetical protein